MARPAGVPLDTRWRHVATVQVDGDPKAEPRPRSVAWMRCRRGHRWMPRHSRSRCRSCGGGLCPRCGAAGEPTSSSHPAKTADQWKRSVPIAPAGFPPLEGPVRANVTVLLPRPKALMRRADPDGPILAPVKPDRDNLEKAILDAMTAGGWWRDDAQVCAGEVRTAYHAKDGAPGAIVELYVPA